MRNYYCTVPAGIESVTAEELKQLGAKSITQVKGRIMFRGSLDLMYRTNLALRTANRVVIDVAQFKARDFTELYDHAVKLPWHTYIGPNDTISIDVKLFNAEIRSPFHASGKLRHAINDALRPHGYSPSVSPENPSISLRVTVHKHHLSIGIDTSGAPLYKRSYRQASHAAPMKETLAAALLLWSGYTETQRLFDPMCGSGTLLCEATLIACNIPPNLNRADFQFMKSTTYRPDVFAKVRQRLEEKIVIPEKLFIGGSDIDPKAVDATRLHLERLGLKRYTKILPKFTLFTKDIKFLDLPPKVRLICNPPYGQRIGKRQKELLRLLSQTFCKGQGFAMIINDESLPLLFLPETKYQGVFNGPIPCTFLRNKETATRPSPPENHR